MNMSASDRDSLAWDAFRYIADEMSPAEVVAFEKRLDDNQPAREAVAEVVRLSAALRAGEPLRRSADEIAPTVAPTASRPGGAMAASLSWMTLGAAASLVFMLTWQAWTERAVVVGTNPAATQSANVLSAESRQVALAWTELPDDSIEELATESEPDSGDDDLEAIASDNSSDTDWEAPSWLSAGVSPDEISSGQSPSGEDAISPSSQEPR